ncbi:hypothetical protein CBG25_15600 [Arsenophonus sp. ENCA]|nr:hypothetical protein CBG25_15600 [Arsenophonus sp. ENCA]
MAYNLSRAVALILWMIFSLLFVQTKIRKRENLHGGILLKKNSTPFATASYGWGAVNYLIKYLLLLKRMNIIYSPCLIPLLIKMLPSILVIKRLFFT